MSYQNRQHSITGNDDSATKKKQKVSNRSFSYLQNDAFPGIKVLQVVWEIREIPCTYKNIGKIREKAPILDKSGKYQGNLVT